MPIFLIYLIFILLGIALGLIYDIFKILRRLVQNKIFVFVIDVFYFLVCSVAIFYFCLVYNSGKIRYFVLQGVLIGAFLHKITISKFIFSFIEKTIVAVKKIRFPKMKLFIFNKK